MRLSSLSSIVSLTTKKPRAAQWKDVMELQLMRNERQKPLNHVLPFSGSFQVPFLRCSQCPRQCLVWITELCDVCRSFPSIHRGGRAGPAPCAPMGALTVGLPNPTFQCSVQGRIESWEPCLACVMKAAFVAPQQCCSQANQGYLASTSPPKWWSCFSPNGLMRSPLICVSSWFVSHLSEKKRKGVKNPTQTQQNPLYFIFFFLAGLQKVVL